MLTDIHIQLEAWAHWSLTKSAGGYPKASAFTRLMPRDNSYQGMGNIDQDAWETELAVQALLPKLKMAVAAYYLGRGTIEQRAKDCGCCRNTLLSRIDHAHEAIRSWSLEKRSKARISASVQARISTNQTSI